MLDAKPSLIPMEQHTPLRLDDDTPLPDPSNKRRLIGRLLYLTITRPYIQYAVNTLSQFMQNPCSSHMDGTYRVLYHLKGYIG